MARGGDVIVADAMPVTPAVVSDCIVANGVRGRMNWCMMPV